ncbi:MAG: c-type cytochrome biosis protein CcmF [Pseudomonadota bacterium]|jgi:cytochrome c-type biogenesis protein CcmF
MIPELGQLALAFALMISLALGILGLAGPQCGFPLWSRMARPLALTCFVLMMASFTCLSISFVVNDFSVVYVAQHSNSQLPLQYRFGAVWGGHEGSLLLWVCILSAWAAAVAIFSRSLPTEMVARVLGVLGWVAFGFILFILFTSNPFDRLMPAAAEGRDLNPLLQDPGLVYHPPMLYMGYVGFSVAFAFSIAALLAGQLDAAWARWSRPWTLAAWIFLTLGIALGSNWAYYELGWGGWWFWDPVENASFMPWLVGTALIHSLAVSEKRGSFKNWTVLLAISAFSLSLLGTFIVRSGVLTSVHAFAADPTRGVFILVFLAIVVGGSLALFAWRAPAVGQGGSFALVSRETLLLINNVLLLAGAAAVLLGTVYPMVIDALNLGKLSVGPPYFNAVFVPIMLPLLLLLPLGAAARWKQDALWPIFRSLKIEGILAIISAVVLPMLMGRWSPMVALGTGLAVWVLAAVVGQMVTRVRSSWPPLGFWGMQLAHLGLAVFVIGVTFVSSYQVERDVSMSPGDTVTIHDTKLTLQDVKAVRGPNYDAMRGDVTFGPANKPGQISGTLHTEKRTYFSSTMPMTEVGIDSSLTRDLYVSMGDATGKNAWAVRVYYKPFVSWIWAGCGFMALGGLLAALDRRYRLRKSAESESTAQQGASS